MTCPKITIYEVVTPNAYEVKNRGAVPLYIANKNPEWRELQAYAEVYRLGLHRAADFIGVISPKFAAKTKISVSEFANFVAINRSSDVHFINPFPQIAYWSLNVWMQGEHAHPGIIDAARHLINAARIPLELNTRLRHGGNALLYCNFWVGNQQFWEEYVGTILMPVVDLLEKGFGKTDLGRVMQKTYHTDSAPFLPFIMERFFSTFLASNTKVKTSAWRHSLDTVLSKYCLNEFERLLVTGMAGKIDKLGPSAGEWSSEAIAELDFLASLFQRHFQDFYEYRPHPHTGLTVVR